MRIVPDSTPLREGNDCHNPAGPGGGQFCSKTGGGMKADLFQSPASRYGNRNQTSTGWYSATGGSGDKGTRNAARNVVVPDLTLPDSLSASRVATRLGEYTPLAKAMTYKGQRKIQWPRTVPRSEYGSHNPRSTYHAFGNTWNEALASLRRQVEAEGGGMKTDLFKDEQTPYISRRKTKVRKGAKPSPGTVEGVKYQQRADNARRAAAQRRVINMIRKRED